MLHSAFKELAKAMANKSVEVTEQFANEGLS